MIKIYEVHTDFGSFKPVVPIPFAFIKYLLPVIFRYCMLRWKFFRFYHVLKRRCI